MYMYIDVWQLFSGFLQPSMSKNSELSGEMSGRGRSHDINIDIT